MKQILLAGLRSLRRQRDEIAAVLRWQANGFAVPPPAMVKRRVLRRAGFPDAPWLETGTSQGTTAAYLASFAPNVITLEPMPDLFESASIRLRRLRNVEVRNVASEKGFESAARALGSRVNFWLDGHFSGAGTFEGQSDTPILYELDKVGELIRGGTQAAVFVDDVRLFAEERSELPSVERSGYPPLSALVGWAQEHGLSWSIEHDIFVARTRGPQ